MTNREQIRSIFLTRDKSKEWHSMRLDANNLLCHAPYSPVIEGILNGDIMFQVLIDDTYKGGIRSLERFLWDMKTDEMTLEEPSRPSPWFKKLIKWLDLSSKDNKMNIIIEEMEEIIKNGMVDILSMNKSERVLFLSKTTQSSL